MNDANKYNCITRTDCAPRVPINVEGLCAITGDVCDDYKKLSDDKRSCVDPEYAKILERLRVGVSTENDTERLIKQCIYHHRPHNKKWIDEIENHPKTMFLFTQIHEKNIKNRDALVH